MPASAQCLPGLALYCGGWISRLGCSTQLTLVLVYCLTTDTCFLQWRGYRRTRVSGQVSAGGSTIQLLVLHIWALDAYATDLNKTICRIPVTRITCMLVVETCSWAQRFCVQDVYYNNYINTTGQTNYCK